MELLRSYSRVLRHVTLGAGIWQIFQLNLNLGLAPAELLAFGTVGAEVGARRETALANRCGWVQEFFWRGTNEVPLFSNSQFEFSIALNQNLKLSLS